MSPDEIEYGDTQGLVRFGYKTMTEARYVLLRVKDVAAAQKWLLDAPVTSAVEQKPPPATALHVAFTADGLRALRVPPSALAGFSREFQSGMTEENRSRRLGDVGGNAPAGWQWGVGSRMPHLVVMFFAEAALLDGFVQGVTGNGWGDAFDEVGPALETASLDRFEPFGFSDGLSQPEIDWLQDRDPTVANIKYGNLAALGEFLLGYRNEYGKYTERPVIDADGTSAELPVAEDAPGMKDAGRNGTYLVMRQLKQDVRGLWQFVWRQAGADFAAADKLASAMVGRTRDGDPLVSSHGGPATPKDPLAQNRFNFDADPDGVECPLGAHIRRANPRNADFVGRPGIVLRAFARLGLGRNAFRDDLTSSVRFHRVLRRGRKYGSVLSPMDALAPAPAGDPERGLHFICLNANISRQFEFLQSAWTMNAKFDGLAGENDPVVGNHDAASGCPAGGSFTMPNAGALRGKVSGIPQFVTVLGGAYFFLPGIRALRYFARVGTP